MTNKTTTKIDNRTPYYTPKEVQEILGTSRTTAYRIMQQLNQELIDKGYIVVRGKISRKYFNERLYC